MAFIFNGIFSLLGTTIKYGLGITMIGGSLAIITKPAEKTFDEFFKNYCKNYPKATSVTDKFAQVVGSSIISTIYSARCADYVACKYMKVDVMNSDSIYFLGIFNHWYGLY